MFSTNVSLPFTTEDAYQGLANVNGMMQVRRNELILEYQVKDNIFGVLKSGTKELHIPFSELSEVQYKLNWFVSRFRLHVKSMRILGEFPVGKDGVISLKIKRKQKKVAQDLASSINLRLSEIRLDMMDDDTNPSSY
jgi:hypothetical protein